MVLQIPDSTNISMLKYKLLENQAIYVFQGNDSFIYKNVRFIRNNSHITYWGVTHEYIEFPENSEYTHGIFDKSEIFILDIGDGGAKHDKFERDIRLLLEGLREDPNNDRYHFYLANSYHDSGRYCEAIATYKKRIELGGWKEEVWYSYYRIGMCFKSLDKISDAVYYWLKGYDFYPDRLEGLYEIIKHYRHDSKHKLAYMLYKEAKQILDKKYNRTGYLFLHDDVYTSKLFYEFTIIAAYV
jgi:tetratricopeptide (TPR) repeat protein